MKVKNLILCLFLLLITVFLSACGSTKGAKGTDYYTAGYFDYKKPFGEVYEAVLIVLNTQGYVVEDHYYPFYLRARAPKNFLKQYVFTDKEELYLEINLTKLQDATRVALDVMRVSTEEPDMSEKVKSERFKENSRLIGDFFNEMKKHID